MPRLLWATLLLLVVQRSTSARRVTKDETRQQQQQRHLEQQQRETCGSFVALPKQPQAPAPQLRIQAADYCQMHGMQLENSATTSTSNKSSPQQQNAGWIDGNDWIAFDVYIPGDGGLWTAQFRIASPAGAGALQLEFFGTISGAASNNNNPQGILQTVSSLPQTGAWQNWETVGLAEEVKDDEDTLAFGLSGGWHTLAIKALEGGWNLQWWELQWVGKLPPCPVWNHGLMIPAENYCQAAGVDVEDTSDTDNGGSNVGWLDADDWLTYRVAVSDDTTTKLAEGGIFATPVLWNVSLRIASPDGRGKLEMAFYNSDDDSENAMPVTSSRAADDQAPVVVQTIESIPQTGGWQNWQTIVHQVTLWTPGQYLLKLRVLEGGWNLNWLQLDLADPEPAPPTVSPVLPPTRSPQAPPTRSPETPDSPTPATGFVRAKAKTIVGPDGEPLILRGMGFGGWMLQEPYMMLAGDAGTGGQYDMFARIEQLVGINNLETYRQAWLDNYCTAADVQELKSSGFNSLRVPLHYNLFTLPIEDEPVRGQDTWLSDGFARLDQLLEWCRQAELYLILDLHAAPGGNGRDAHISDYDPTKPNLWQDDENIRKTIALWVEWARRYRDEPWIGGYDLLNEPNWNFDAGGGHPNGCSDVKNAPLKAFYDQAVPAIRQVDPHHLIFIEGNCWSNNHNGLWPIDDDNVALSLHRYWIANTVDSIQKFLDWQDLYQVPLWMGESGENHNQWYREAVALLESHNIGWAWWTWKKMESSTGSYSVLQPDGYQTLLNYWKLGSDGTAPDANFVFGVLMQLASNVLLENAIRNSGAIDALTNHVRSCEEVDAVDMTESEILRVEAENYCNMLGFASENTLDVGGGYNVGWTDAGDWLAFKVDFPLSGRYKVDYRVASAEGMGGFELELFDSGVVLGTIDALPQTGDWQEWITVSKEVVLTAGTQTVAIKATAPGWNLNWFEMSYVAP